MRTLSFEARERQQRQVDGLHRQGWTYEAIAAETGLLRTGVFTICQCYAREGVLNADLKAVVTTQARAKGDLTKATVSHLR